MTRHPQPPLTDARLNADGDEARISSEAADASHRLLEIEDAPDDTPLVAGGQGRDVQYIIDGATIIAFVLAAAGLAATVLVVWRAIGGAA